LLRANACEERRGREGAPQRLDGVEARGAAAEAKRLGLDDELVEIELDRGRHARARLAEEREVASRVPPVPAAQGGHRCLELGAWRGERRLGEHGSGGAADGGAERRIAVCEPYVP